MPLLHLGMHDLLSHVNAVHPWVTMPHSPQHLLKLFTYNLTSRFTTTASLSVMPACSFLQMTCSPQICSSALCLMCRSVSIFRIERKLSSSISSTISFSLAFFQTSHISSALSLVYLFSCEAYRFLSALLLSICVSFFSDRACNPCILWWYQVIFNSKYVVETFKHRCTCNLQIQICYSFIWCFCFCVNETPLSLHF